MDLTVLAVPHCPNALLLGSAWRRSSTAAAT
jgi:hypothetical protein